MPETRVQCPNCKASLKSSDAPPGKRLRCPRCKAPVPTPADDAPAEDSKVTRRRRPAPAAKDRTLFVALAAAAAVPLLACGVGLGLFVSGVFDRAPRPDGPEPIASADKDGPKPKEDKPLEKPPPRPDDKDKPKPPPPPPPRPDPFVRVAADDAALAERLARARPAEAEALESLAFEAAPHPGIGVGVLAKGGIGRRPTFSPDGRLVATADGGTVRLWDVAAASLLREMPTPAKSLAAVAFTPDGEQVLVAGADQGKVWSFDVRTGKPTRALDVPYPVGASLAVSPAAGWLVASTAAAGEASLQTWSLADGIAVVRFGEFPAGPPLLALRPDGKVLAAATAADGKGEVRLFDAETGKPGPRRFAGAADLLAFSPDGWTLAAGLSRPAEAVRLLDVAAGTERLLAHQDAVVEVGFSGDGKLLLTATARHLRIWDVASGKELAKHDGPPARATSSPAGVFFLDERGEVWRTADLLEDRLTERLAEARKLADVRRWGVGFVASPKPKGKAADLTEVARSVPLDGVDLRSVPEANDGWLVELKSISGLRHLFLEKTRVGDAGLGHVAAMKDLETLDLADLGRVTDAGLATVAGLVKLRRLYLGGTRVTGAGFVHLGGMTELNVLVLDDRPDAGKNLKHLAGLKKVRELSLASADVTDADLEHLGAMAELRVLLLSRNADVRGGGLARLADLPRLRELDLDGTDVGDDGLSHVGKLKSLRRLDLRKTPATDEGLAALRGLSLESLALPPATTDAGLARVEGLAKLASLDLGDTKVGDAGMASVAKLTGLTELTLDDTDVGDEGLSALHGLKALRRLSLRRTKATDRGVKALGEALPGVRVTR